MKIIDALFNNSTFLAVILGISLGLLLIFIIKNKVNNKYIKELEEENDDLIDKLKYAKKHK